MAMAVETFEAVETMADGTVECDEAAIELIESLGLAGQKQLLQSRTDGQVVRSPYRKMTAIEALVYETICPKKSKLSEYADGPVPLRVLQVAAHAKEHFDRLMVWSADDAAIKDPVLIGVKAHPDYDILDRERFLLARWGDELEPFAVLAEKTLEILKASRRTACKQILAEVTAHLSLIDTLTIEQLVGVSSPCVAGVSIR